LHKSLNYLNSSTNAPTLRQLIGCAWLATVNATQLYVPVLYHNSHDVIRKPSVSLCYQTTDYCAYTVQSTDSQSRSNTTHMMYEQSFSTQLEHKTLLFCCCATSQWKLITLNAVTGQH